ncbi:putative multidrug ABC transporter ATP-binding protein YbhF [Thermoflexales bacterium]|nr:putative multidrug ABC transporter ATP-binding protein YbhF [Thermoflexales bacterium]
MKQATPPEPSQMQPVQANNSVISAQHLTKKFGAETAVQDVSFDVFGSSIFGFIGPSGSGKTTTVRLLTGVYTPTEGQVTVLNCSPAKFSQSDRARLGYMPQLFVLYPNLTVWENLNFAASLYGMGLFRRKRLKEVLTFVELYEHRSKLARNISGGMLRRLSLATTLVHDPELLFLDEPTAGIDPVLRHKFWDHFRELKSQGRTIFITTQYVSEADNCDLVGVQNQGKLLLVDTPQGIRHHAYGGDMVDFSTTEPFDFQAEAKLRLLSFVRDKTVRTGFNSMRIIVDEASTATPELMEWAQQQNIQVQAVEEYRPSFEDVFVELVRPEVSHA